MMLDVIGIANAVKKGFRFDNQIILVTGASRGIGRALALLLADRGATVVLLASSESNLETVYDEIVARGAPTPIMIPVDLNILNMASAKELSNHLDTTFGRLDGLVHIAGILGSREPLATHRADRWTKTLQINLNSIFFLTQTLLPLLERSLAGRIVFASSSVGQRVEAYWGAYAVSKAGIDMFAGMLAQELENTSHIRVVTINPGATATRMRAEAKPGEDPRTLPTTEIVAQVFLVGLSSYAEQLHGKRFNARDVMALLGTWPV